MIHALRDFLVVRDIWKMLVNSKYWPEFFKGDIIEWLMFNNGKEIGKLDGLSWRITFGEAIRRIWLRRNAWIFRNEMCDVSNLYWNIIVATKHFEESLTSLELSGMTNNRRIGR